MNVTRLSIVFPQKQTWTTTRFEKFWYSKVKKMKFREPFSLIPINLKLEYTSYGGDEYWDEWEKIFTGNESLDSSPIEFINEIDNEIETNLKIGLHSNILRFRKVYKWE